MLVGIMATLHGKAFVPSAGERGPVKLKSQNKTLGKVKIIKCYFFCLTFGFYKLDCISNVNVSYKMCHLCSQKNEGTPVTFSKFEEKKSNEKGRRVNTMRRLFWGGPSPPKRGNSFSRSMGAFKHNPGC